MTIQEAIYERHSVRAFTERKIDEQTRNELANVIAKCNQDSGLHIQVCYDEPKAFDHFLAHYGNFANANNYIAIVGKKADGTAEKCGYYGEKIVLAAQQLGLNSCWVGGTYSKGKCSCQIDSGEKLYIIIAIGYGQTQGTLHKGKSLTDVVPDAANMPDWFKNGVEFALLAPTAVNQQKFKFSLATGNKVTAKAGLGPFAKLDLGIVKYHFEIGAGDANWDWA